jgi:hypothetical protein
MAHEYDIRKALAGNLSGSEACRILDLSYIDVRMAGSGVVYERLYRNHGSIAALCSHQVSKKNEACSGLARCPLENSASSMIASSTSYIHVECGMRSPLGTLLDQMSAACLSRRVARATKSYSNVVLSKDIYDLRPRLRKVTALQQRATAISDA